MTDHPDSRVESFVTFGLKTNLLYDALLVPNLNFELGLGDRFSVNLGWKYAWWNNDRSHWYWRIYGGDMEFRLWLGRRSLRKRLEGHHIGLYGDMFTYDFETGGKGYLGEKWNYAAGLSYGYALPVARRLKLDFSLGVGYMGGIYKEYEPVDDCYVWQVTKKRRWIGPTRLELSLVWLIK